MRTSTKLGALLLALALVLAACGGDGTTSEEGNAGGGVAGEVRLDGSSTVGPLSEVAAERYMQQGPGVRVTVAISGTGGGFQKFCIGETDGNDSSRLIKDEEIATCEENGIAYDYIQVANDALSIVINHDMPVECLSVAQVAQIWDDGSTVETWGDVDGLDLPDDIASLPLTPYGPGSDSGTFDYFTEEINGESGRIRLNYVDIGEDDNAAVTAVSGDIGAMGYIPFSYYQESLELVKAVAIDGGEGCVEATPENVETGTYAPLGRGLFVYLSDVALSRPEVLDFAEFYIDNAPELAELAGFVPMTAEQIEEQRAKIAALTGS
jgi:phosphate transport system substrate-binding protein